MSLQLTTRVASHVYRENRKRLDKLLHPGRFSSPWMRIREQEVLEELLIRLRPGRCLEWGTGYSTLHFPGFLPAASTWLSIEHDPAWHRNIAERVTRAGVELVCVPPNRQPWTDANNDGAYADLASYIEYPDGRGPFDFILVDGRARVACLDKAVELVADDGVVCLHDANRTYYHRPFKRFAHTLFFHDYRRDQDGGIWFGSKRRDLTELVRVDYHQELWRVADRFGFWLLKF